MIADGVEANAICYNQVIHACVRSGDAQRAALWIDWMTERGVSPTVRSFNTMMSMHVKAGNTAEATRWFNKMLSAGLEPDVVSYNTLIAACAKAADIPSAEMCSRKSSPPASCRTSPVTTR